MASVFAWVNCIRLLDRNNAPTNYAFHDTIVGQPLTIGGATYTFLSFRLDVGGGEAGGSRSSATFQAALDEILVNVITEACDRRYRLENKCYRLIADTMTPDILYCTELWECASYNADTQNVVMQLRVPGNAVNETNPGRRLSSKLVGALPTVGGVSLR